MFDPGSSLGFRTLPDESYVYALNVRNPGALPASSRRPINIPLEKRQELLATPDAIEPAGRR